MIRTFPKIIEFFTFKLEWNTQIRILSGALAFSLSHQLPPVKSKKKVSKRCFICFSQRDCSGWCLVEMASFSLLVVDYHLHVPLLCFSPRDCSGWRLVEMAAFSLPVKDYLPWRRRRKSQNVVLYVPRKLVSLAAIHAGEVMKYAPSYCLKIYAQPLSRIRVGALCRISLLYSYILCMRTV